MVFSPQIIENFRRQSAEGLSLLFLIVWLAGDLFNILGAILQGVLPTMIVLAVYYTLADIVLLGQCLFYRFQKLRAQNTQISQTGDQHATVTASSSGNSRQESATEVSPLLRAEQSRIDERATRPRSSSIFSGLSSLDGTHLSPAVPLITEPNTLKKPQMPQLQPASTLQIILFNIFSIFMVCCAGILGWYVSHRTPKRDGLPEDPWKKQQASLELDTWGQIFGYFCAALYLGSRVPQLLLNYERKSTEGVSLLFFLFSCVGNLTYVLSIFAYSPICKKECQVGEISRIYGQYMLVNASWILGSLGTLFLDMAIFVQFIIYRENEIKNDEC